MAAPEIAFGLDLAVSAVGLLFGSSKKSPTAEQVLHVIDARMAEVISDIATTKSKRYRRECETRLHELLGILNEWEKIN